MNRTIVLKCAVFSLAISLFGAGVARAEHEHAATPDGWSQGACKADAEKLCPGVEPGHGAVQDCLKQHEAELSTGCKGNVTIAKEKMESRKAEIMAACKADQEQFCKDVTPGEGRERSCLHAYSDKISAGCKAALKPMHSKQHMKMHSKQHPK